MCWIIFIIILAILILYIIPTKNGLDIFRVETDNISNVYHDMKTGDLLLITDDKYDIKSLRIVYNDTLENTIGYIHGDKKDDGHLTVDTIHNLLKENKKNYVLWLSLLQPLASDRVWALKHTLQSLYTNKYNVGINTVFIYDENKRDFFDCPTYCAKLLHDINILKFTNPACFSDPTECIQQSYNNSAYITAKEYYHMDKLVRLI